MIAIDGKDHRGARALGGQAPHLVAALDHTASVVLGQFAVADTDKRYVYVFIAERPIRSLKDKIRALTSRL